MKDNQKAIITEIKAFVKQKGSQSLAARSLDITASYLNDILNGRRPISAVIAAKFGYEWRLEKSPSKTSTVLE